MDRIKNRQVLFFISYALFITLTLLRTTFISRYIPDIAVKGCLAFCVLLLVISEIFLARGSIHSVVALMIGCCFGVLAIYVQTVGYLTLFATVIFVFAARDIPFRKIAAFSAIWLLAVLLIVIICSQIGLIQDFVTDDERARHYLGFRYALFPSIVSMNITMLIVYVRRKNILWIELAIAAAFNVWIFVLTASRLAFILSMAIIAVGAVLKIWPNFMLHKKKIKYLMAAGFIVLAIASLTLSSKYNPDSKIQYKINHVLSDRLKYQKQGLEEYDFSLFGNDVEMHGHGLDQYGRNTTKETGAAYFYIDNNYVVWYLKDGFLFFIAVLAICTAMSIRSVRYEKYGYLSIILFIMAVFCVIQDTFLQLHYNTFLMAAGNLLMSSKTEEEIEEADGMSTGIHIKNRFHIKNPIVRKAR